MSKLQGGYVAKQCPARAQWDTVRPCEPLPPSPFLQRLFTRGRDFESEVVAQLLELHPDALVVTQRTPQNGAEREQETLQALQNGVPLILGGRLPADPIGRRVGEPDLLVAAAGEGYRAADVKHHLTLDIEGIPAHCSAPETVTWETAEPAPARKNKDDLFQLSHYQRMLEAIGMAAPGDRLGGIIGKEKVVTWLDLDTTLLNGEPVVESYDSRVRMAACHHRHRERAQRWTRALSCSWGRSARPSAASARGVPGAGRSWNRAPATSAWCRT